jgi:IS30 family transposase
LARFWSPEQVAKRLRLEFPSVPEMWVSHETIYQSLFVYGRAELRRELVQLLPSGQVRRRPKDRQKPAGQLADMVTISERPAEVKDRAVPATGKATCSAGRSTVPPSARWSNARRVT